ncbi:MAG: 16S rRNA (cytosine(967)-C(5))-methyltransferase RsmB [Clostridia bacterium]|nr:16S rRNA (cytosine(967)-C(5))-methyltransferase RsmB [Clostridia bacterium]
MIDLARKQAFLLLDDIISNKKYANLTLKNGLNGFDERDRAFICNLVYGTLDKMISLDYVISLFAKGRIQPKIKNVLRLGAYQILFLERVPDSAAVNTSVELAQSIGKGALKGYVNGVLRSISKNKENIPYPKDNVQRISYKYSYPEFLVRELISELGDKEAESFCGHVEDHKTCLRVDENKASVSQIKEQLNAQSGVYFDNCIYVSGEPALLENGVCSVQGEASVAVVNALKLEENDTLLDCCAAPGGKTVYAATKLKSGKILALDKHEHRVELIKKNAQRCGYEHIITALSADMAKNNSFEAFDKVLVDAPCSGLGVIGQKPEIKNTCTPEGFAELEKIQKTILQNASAFVKRGGTLVYSTCTVRNKENIDNVTYFLENNPEFSLDSLEGCFGESFEKNRDLSKGYVQLYPHKDKIDGFFIARMKRN